MITRIFETSTETARAFVLQILQIVAENPNDTILNIALSGGSTPALMFRIWANDFSEITPWHRLRFFWVDERCVPPHDEASNYGMTKANLLSSVPIPGDNVYRIKGENNPELEAIRYEKMVKDFVPLEDGFPAFDIILLGVGTDGHTSSIFPGQEDLLTTPVSYVVSKQPSSGQLRVALTGQPIMHSARLFFLLSGKSKHLVFNDIIAENDAGPAAYVAHHAIHSVEVFYGKTEK